MTGVCFWRPPSTPFAQAIGAGYTLQQASARKYILPPSRRTSQLPNNLQRQLLEAIPVSASIPGRCQSVCMCFVEILLLARAQRQLHEVLLKERREFQRRSGPECKRRRIRMCGWLYLNSHTLITLPHADASAQPPTRRLSIHAIILVLTKSTTMFTKRYYSSTHPPPTFILSPMENHFCLHPNGEN